MEKSTPPIVRAQPTIRSFFQPRQPNYIPSPNTTVPKPNLSPTITVKEPPSSIVLPTTPKEPTFLLPKPASITPISTQHITPLRRINALLLPITYPDSFYNAISRPSPPSSQNFSRAILWEEKVIGGLVCRVDRSLSPTSTPQKPAYTEGVYDIYIQSLGLLSPYRGKGLATRLLDDVVQTAIGEKEVRIGGLYAHVWTENNEALEWYSARGFKVEGGVISGYYPRLKPDTALILRRKLNTNDHLTYVPSTAPKQENAPLISPLSHPPPPTNTPISSTPTTPLPPTRPNAAAHTRSFQDRGPEREWNDLPEDVVGNSGLLKGGASQVGSVASSRSSSRSGMEAAGGSGNGNGRGRKKRVYPAAAFGG